MERDNPLNDLTDEQLLALFEGIDPPAPPREFVARTMQAVVRAPLPPGRKPLRDPLRSLLGWAAVIAAVGFAVVSIAVIHPIVAASFSSLITRGVGTGVWFMRFAETGFRLLDVLRTTGLAVSRAAATAEGTTGLVLTALIGALSLSALHRMLISEGDDSRWQELS
jgi:hypothetical protein